MAASSSESVSPAPSSALRSPANRAVAAIRRSPHGGRVTIEDDLDAVDDGSSSGSLFLTVSARSNVSRPFVCRLVQQCLVVDTLVNDTRFVPHDFDCAVMFVDISGFSAIADVMASKGAHALAAAVNGCFEPILDGIKAHGGAVVNFAGDALLAVWPGAASLAEASLAAVRCAVELQDTHGAYAVPDTDLTMRFHVGVTCGRVTAHVLQSKHSSAHVMQSAYYYVGGTPVRTVGAVVDATPTGTVGVSQQVSDLCGDCIATEPLDNSSGRKVIAATPAAPVADCESPGEASRELDPMDDSFFSSSMMSSASSPRRSNERTSADDLFVPPVILSKLRTGLKAHDMAEMRLVYVLFIKKTGLSDATEWFEEIHEILADLRCPITQILDDDKGTHVIAAMNLYVGEDGAADAALQVVRALALREVGCVVGVAGGECFCGVVGNDEVCRWDMTGWACVRACRLMQYAETEKMPVAVDVTVVEAAKDKSLLRLHNPEVTLKGTPDPVLVFTLTDAGHANIGAIVAINEYCPNVYAAERAELIDCVVDPSAGRRLPARTRARRSTLKYAPASLRRQDATPLRPRSVDDARLCAAAIVLGFCNAGKKTLILSALHNSGIATLMHRTMRGSPRLEVCKTLAGWFAHSPVAALREHATALAAAQQQRHVAQSLELAVQLLVASVRHGQQTAIVIDRAQYLDDATLRLINVVMRQLSVETAPDLAGRPGKLLWFFALTPQLGGQTVSKVCTLVDADLPVVRLNGIDTDAVSEMHRSFAMYSLDAGSAEALRWTVDGMPGTVMPVMEWAGPTAHASFAKFRSGEISEAACVVMIDRRAEVQWDEPFHDDLHARPYRLLVPSLMHRLAQFCDVLPPRQQILLKVLACLSVGDYGCPVEVVTDAALAYLRNATKDMMFRHLETLRELMLVTYDDDVEGRCGIATRPLAELLLETFTPQQRKGVAARGLKELTQPRHVRDGCVGYYLTAATLAFRADDLDQCDAYLLAAWPFAKTKAQQRAVLRAIAQCGRRPEDLVSDVKRRPCMPELVRWSKQSAMPMCCEDAKCFEPPLVLGPLAGHLSALAPLFVKQTARNAGVEVDGIPTLPTFDAASYLQLCGRFERFVPLCHNDDAQSKLTLDAERSLIESWVAGGSDQTIEANAKAFLQYVEDVVRPRARRVTRFARTVSSLDVTWVAADDEPRRSPSPGAMSFSQTLSTSTDAAPLANGRDESAADAPLRVRRRAALEAAFGLLSRAGGSDTEETARRVREALMALAVRDWSSPYPYMTVAKLRDCWLFGWIDAVELKAILMLFVVEERPARLKVATAADWSDGE